MIEIKHLTKIYKKGKNEVKALNDVSFVLPDKGLVFIVGKSGSGKSTFINMLGGLDDVTSGSILVDGLDITKLDTNEFDNYRNHYLGIIYQNYNLFENETVLENIKVSSDISDTKVTNDDIENLMKDLDLYKNKGILVKDMSGGQKQRVAIARALIKNPELILADEPTGNLDSKTSKIIFDLLKKISEDKLIVVISHDDKSARDYADRIIRISDGEITENLIRNTNTSLKTFIPVDESFKDEEINEINSLLNGSKYIVSKKDKLFIETNDNYKSNNEKLNIKKYKISFKNSFKTALKFFKNSKGSLITTLILSIFIISLLTLALCFSNFDGSNAIDSVIENHSVNSLDINKAYSRIDNVNDIEKGYYLEITEEDLEIFDDVDTSKMYKKYIIPLITNVYNYKIEDGIEIDESNYENFYSSCGSGLVVCDIDHLNHMFGDVKVLAGSLYKIEESTELIVTDYFADTLLYYNENFRSDDSNDPYQNLIGKNIFERYEIGCVIDSGYKEKYKELIDLYNLAWSSPTKTNKILKDISNSMLLLDFIDEATSSLNLAYSLNENFIEEYGDKANFAKFMNVYLYDIDDPSTAKYNSVSGMYVHYIESICSELEEGEVIMSSKMYNTIFGTNITGANDTNFEEKELLIENFGFDQESIDTPSQVLTLKVVGINDYLLSSGWYIMFTDKTTTKTILEKSYRCFGLIFDDIDESYNIYKIFKPNYYYAVSESFNSIFELIDIVNIFSIIFSLVAVLLLIVLFIIIVSHNLRIIKKETYRIGVYKSLGYSNMALSLSILIDNIITVFLILVLSVLFTFGINYYADLALRLSLASILSNDIYAEITLLEFKFIYPLIFNGIIFVFTILSSFIPLISIRRIKPNEIIRNAE